MEDLEDKIDKSYLAWRELLGLDRMTPREIYDVGYRHGVENLGKEVFALAVERVIVDGTGKTETPTGIMAAFETPNAELTDK